MVVAFKNSSDKLEERRLSRLGLLSFGPAIAGSLLESIFIDPSLDPAIVGSVNCFPCVLHVYIYHYLRLNNIIIGRLLGFTYISH